MAIEFGCKKMIQPFEYLIADTYRRPSGDGNKNKAAMRTIWRMVPVPAGGNYEGRDKRLNFTPPCFEPYKHNSPSTILKIIKRYAIFCIVIPLSSAKFLFFCSIFHQTASK